MVPIFNNLFDEYDQNALRTKRYFYQYFWLGGIIAGLIAVLVFAISISFQEYLGHKFRGLVIPTVEILMVGVSFIFLGILAPKFKSEFLKHRHLSEYLRLHILMESCGLPIIKSKKVHEKYPLDDSIKRLEEEYESLSMESQDITEAKNLLTKFVKKQREYHTDTVIKKSEKNEHLIEIALKIILYIFIFVAISKFIFELLEFYKPILMHHYIYLLYIFKFCIIFLPPLYAALEGIFYFREWKRNMLNSSKINEKYKKIQTQIENADTLEEIIHQSKHLNKIFWDEQYNWIDWYHNKKVEPKI